MRRARGRRGWWLSDVASGVASVAFIPVVLGAGSPSPSPDEPCGEIGIIALPLLLVAGVLLVLALGVVVLVLALGLTGPTLGWLRRVTRASPPGADDTTTPTTPDEVQGVAWLLRK